MQLNNNLKKRACICTFISPRLYAKNIQRRSSAPARRRYHHRRRHRRRRRLRRETNALIGAASSARSSLRSLPRDLEESRGALPRGCIRNDAQNSRNWPSRGGQPIVERRRTSHGVLSPSRRPDDAPLLPDRE